MNCPSRFVLLLLLLTFAARAIGEDNNSSVEMGSFVILKQSDGSEFRAFVAGPADAWTEESPTGLPHPTVQTLGLPLPPAQNR
jgi:hypothetical protein